MCPFCGSVSSACCPDCGNIIPNTALDDPFSSIAVVGSAMSGKTVFLTVALSELRSKVRYLALSPLTRETFLWLKRNEEDLFFDGRPLVYMPPVRQPLIWRIVNVHHRIGKTLSKHTVTILDVCGDLMNDVDILASEYLKNCSSIFFVADPLKMHGVKQTTVIDKE